VRIAEDFGPFAIAGDAVWITAFEDNQLVAYGIATGDELVRIPVGLHPNVVFEADGSVWGYNLHGRFIERIDPKRLETVAEWDVAAMIGPADAPLTDAAIWFGAYDLQRLIAIDPATNGVAASVEVPIQPCGATVFPSFVLGSGCGSKAVVRVDATAGTVLPAESLLGVPYGWAHVGGLAWTTLAPGDDLPTTRFVGFDAETLLPRDAVDVGAEIRSVAVAFDALWVSTDRGVLRFELGALQGG
jgi:hypothetical protein